MSAVAAACAGEGQSRNTSWVVYGLELIWMRNATD